MDRGDRLVSSFGTVNTELNPEAGVHDREQREMRSGEQAGRCSRASNCGRWYGWLLGPLPLTTSSGTTTREAHNDYLELLASGGLIGWDWNLVRRFLVSQCSGEFSSLSSAAHVMLSLLLELQALLPTV